MNGARQSWLVARREMRERSRSKAFRAGLVIMVLLVVASIAVPALIEDGKVTKHVGFTGATPTALPTVVTDQGRAVDVTVRVHHYDNVASGEAAVRDEKVDVLVVDAQQLKWRGKADERLRAVVTGSIQLVAVQQRAVAAGIDPDQLLQLVAPVPVTNEELGLVAGRSPDNEAAAAIMAILLFVSIIMYGNLVLTGVAEEKSSRVVEVLLARMPARNLLAGKVIGIGLLGFAQLAITAVAALIATMAFDSVDVPGVSGGVLAWVVVWFVLGYAIFAMAYGALGSLTSRAEDASTAAGPASYMLIVSYWVAYIVVATDPQSGWSKLVSLFPATAPFAMPGRIALGAAEWWEPLVATVVTLAAIAGLVVLAGRVYTGAILHTGATLKLREAWRGTTAPAPGGMPTSAPTLRSGPWWRRAGAAHGTAVTWPATASERWTNAALIGVAIALAAIVFALTHD
ncbi:MAG TPA: ABC transporter permease, partial [Ilumatobacteraceae bacterium]|nr:ABC transporter permease [Ilumatobacteraceae bacterium]